MDYIVVVEHICQEECYLKGKTNGIYSGSRIHRSGKERVSWVNIGKFQEHI